MACRLRQAGIETFTIYEKADAVGGTWRDNTYPGAACDVPSHLYSLSFAPKTDWTRKFPEQPEILDYLERGHRPLRPAARTSASAPSSPTATWDEDAGAWRLDLRRRHRRTRPTCWSPPPASSTGRRSPTSRASTSSTGTVFHSARWDHDHDLTGRDVAVIGIGASAIQFVPEVAKEAGSLTLFQRSSNYVGPKPDGEFSERAKRTLRRGARPPSGSTGSRSGPASTPAGCSFRQGSRAGRLRAEDVRRRAVQGR